MLLRSCKKKIGELWLEGERKKKQCILNPFRQKCKVSVTKNPNLFNRSYGKTNFDFSLRFSYWIFPNNFLIESYSYGKTNFDFSSQFSCWIFPNNFFIGSYSYGKTNFSFSSQFSYRIFPNNFLIGSYSYSKTDFDSWSQFSDLFASKWYCYSFRSWFISVQDKYSRRQFNLEWTVINGRHFPGPNIGSLEKKKLLKKKSESIYFLSDQNGIEPFDL